MLHHFVSVFDRSITALVARFPASFTPFFTFMSFIGHPISTISIGGVILLAGLITQKPLVALSGVSVWLTMGISTILKLATERARPMTDYVAGMKIHSYSFPSGHTTGATIAFGLLAFYAFRLLPAPLNVIVAAIFVLLLVSVGISRIYLGAHFPSDVLGGFILGAVVLTLVIFVVKPLG